MCTLTNERYKTLDRIFILSPGSCPGVGLGALGRPGGPKNFKHGHVVYQIDGYYEQNRMQVQFLSMGKTGDLTVRSKGQISLNFGYQFCQFIDFYTKLCVRSYY